MREIKFRAIIQVSEGKYQTHFFTLNAFIKPLFSMRELIMPWLKAGNEPDRYTGLKDKNDKPIFEGDILQEYSGKSKGRKMYVFFSNHWLKYQTNCRGSIDNLSELSTSRISIKVIGTIYENKELLEPANVS